MIGAPLSGEVRDQDRNFQSLGDSGNWRLLSNTPEISVANHILLARLAPVWPCAQDLKVDRALEAREGKGLQFEATKG